MKEKINIAEILKDKPQRTILYDYLHNIDVEFDNVEITEIETSIWCTRDKGGYNELFGYSKLGTLRGWLDGLQILLPSKEMRDWSKFAWKKGDVLMADLDNICIFDKWNNDEYTEFDAAFVTPDYRSDVLKTKYWHKVIGVNVIRRYISKIERNNGGKLNLTTLEIEKAQPEFKDGDILCVIESSNNYHYILIYEGQDDEHIYRYVTMLENNSLIIEKGSYFTKPKDYSMRYATEEEKQQLFDALDKENKAWDAEKKQLVDLPKCEFEPFDKVLVRDIKDEYWRPAFFASFDEHSINGYAYGLVGDPDGLYCKYCIPYNEQTKHLLGTKDEWKGGEG
jgi:hypothetical protein